MNKNPAFRQKIEAGEVVLGLNIRHSRTPEIAAIVKDCGFDWIMLDDEHNPLEPSFAYETHLYARRLDLMSFIRVRRSDRAEIAAHLSNCPMGLIVPEVSTPDEAELVAASSRFAPRGNRAVPGFFPQLGYRSIPMAQATQAVNEETFVVCMIENREGLDNVEAIAAVDGVDALLIGASDLTYDLGMGGQYDSPVLRDAIQKVTAAARAHGKASGVGGMRGDDNWRAAIDAGVQIVLMESDLSMLTAQMSARVDYFNALK